MRRNEMVIQNYFFFENQRLNRESNRVLVTNRKARATILIILATLVNFNALSPLATILIPFSASSPS